MASPYKSLLIWVKNFFGYLYTKYSSGLYLGEGLCIFTSFYFPDSGLYLLNGFDFYFDLHSFFYKNIFYKNIEAEICEILRIF